MQYAPNTNKVDNVKPKPFFQDESTPDEASYLGRQEEPEKQDDGGQKNKLECECVTNM